MNPIRVLVADDHPVFRYGIRALLLAATDMELAGEAANGNEAVQLALADPPDIVLMDINMPDMNGIQATCLLLEQLPSLAVVVLTMSEDDEAVLAALAAGARGYIVKGNSSEQILASIRSAARGLSVFSPTIVNRLPRHVELDRSMLSVVLPEWLAQLTPREREIIDLIAAGFTNAAIADQLFLSVKTVSNRVGEIFDKLGASNRNEAIVVAREAGLGRSG